MVSKVFSHANVLGIFSNKFMNIETIMLERYLAVQDHISLRSSQL